MADIEQLTRAFMAADKAGDTKSAQLLANAIREQTASQPTVDAPVAAQEAPDTSYSGALRQGYDQAGALVGKGIQSGGELIGNEAVTNYGSEMAARNEAEIEASNYQRPEGADGIISNLREGDLANAGRSLAYGAAEAAPQVAGGVVASVGAGLAATTAPVLGTAAALGGTAYGITNALGANRQEKEDQGMDPTATATDLASAVASGLIELTPLKGGGATLKVVREAVQEGAQEGLVIGGNAVQGGEYVGEDVLERMGDAAITGGAIAKGVNVGISTVNKAGKVVLRPKEEVDPETAKAAGDVARIMQETAETNGYNLKDIDPNSKKGAKEALEQARARILADIDTARDSLVENAFFDISRADKSRFKQIISSARTKVARTVSKEDIKFIKDKFGMTEPGQMLIQSMYKANVTTELSAAGIKGGVSQFTDTFNPIPRIMGGSYNPMGAVAGNLNTGAAIATGGQSLAAQIPLVVGGRAIDAVTGRRSKVNRFVNKNKANEGLGPVSGIDIEGTAQRRKDLLKATKKAKVVDPQIAKDKAAKELRSTEDAQKKQFYEELEARRNVQQYLAGEGPKEGSPREILHSVIENTYGAQDRTTLELDAEIKRTLSEMLSDASVTAERKMAIRDYFKTVEGGKSIIEGSPLNDVTSMMRSKSSGFKSKAKPKDNADPKLPARQEAGKIANQAALATLKSKAAKDTSIRKEDRKSLNDAFKELSNPLGKNPVDRLGKIVAKAEGKLMDSKLSEKYLKPYVDRIKEQQPKDNLNPVGFGLY